VRTKRTYSVEFLEYQKFIVNHPNYSTLPNKQNAKKETTWVKVGDKDREKWWDQKKEELGVIDRASVARAIHPPELNGYKPCQICGELKSINYVYPQSRIITKLNDAFSPISFSEYEEELHQIADVVEAVFQNDGLRKLAQILGLKTTFQNANELVIEAKKNHRILSPGVMSNAPDRLDGFHTYNACCRKEQDTGRHKTNLARYQTDRRAYENWADGDWRAADRLMGQFQASKQQVPCPKCGDIAKMTPDHIGPVSLGFTHRMKFHPMCTRCNSSKNNRLTFDDVRALVNDESQGEQIISWHSRFLWDKLKNQITSDEEAVLASKVMRQNLHDVLTVLSFLEDKGQQKYLERFLNPQFAYYDYYFSFFDPATGKFEANKFAVISANTKSLASRYVRISFESLKEYSTKLNRKSKDIVASSMPSYIESVLSFAKESNTKKADDVLFELLSKIASLHFNSFESSKK
jgi:Alw26I/Eco31I/Esp3I family type II restriction endonuclease